MIVGIGVDIIEVARIKRQLELNPEFQYRIFSDREIDYCEARADSGLSYAVRFAAKEAFMKALGTGWNNEVSWREIESLKDDKGAPHLHISGRTAVAVKQRGISAMHVSMSHEKEYAVAVVILEQT